MPESQLNSSIQPRKLANKEGEVKFGWPVKTFKRFAELLHSDSGDIKVVVTGYYDDRRRCLLDADIKAKVELECQTTFDPIAYEIDKKVTFCALVAESQFADIEEEFEPVLMEEGFLDVAQIIEDELILSIPIVANKPLNEITEPMSYGELDEIAIAAEKAANNPFAALKDLKKT